MCKISYPVSIPIFNRINLSPEIFELKKLVDNYISKKQDIKLVVGDGSFFKTKTINTFPEWISTDRNALDLRSSYEFLSAIPLSSVKYIYMNQVLEHIQCYELSTALINLNKVLVIGGELHISVPDYYDPVFFLLSVDCRILH